MRVDPPISVRQSAARARTGRGALAFVAATAVIGILAGCSQSVAGQARPSAAPAPEGSAATESTETSPATSGNASLAELLLTPDAFPRPFDAVVLPAHAVPMAAPDLVGVPRGAAVDPSECAPAPQNYGSNGTAMAVGTDNANRSTISVELTRVDSALGALEEQTRRCPSMSVSASGVVTTVKTVLLPPPPIDADKTLALRRTVLSPAAAAGEQQMLTLLAQVGDVRVAVTLMTFGSTPPATAPLDEAFTAAVQKVRSAN